MSKMALEDITVADFGQTWAGPHAGRVLADMGARVIKIESMKRMDVIRSLPPWVTDQEHTLNNSGYYNWLNRNKLGVTIDLTTPSGLELANEIIKISDVMIENFSRGVMDKFGLDYASVKEVNPEIIYVSLKEGVRIFLPAEQEEVSEAVFRRMQSALETEILNEFYRFRLLVGESQASVSPAI